MSGRFRMTQRDDTYVLEDLDGGAEAIVAPALGNNVTHLRVRPAGRNSWVDVFIPPAGPDGLEPSGYGAGNPILFPFPNRVRRGRYRFEGREHQLDVNEPARGNHIHGLVASLPWEVEDSGADAVRGAWQRASIRLEAHPAAARQYPFPCTLMVTTRLAGGALVQEVEVRNTGRGWLPMGFGTHPWFPATLDGGARAATEVMVPGNAYWELENLVPTGRTIPVDRQPGTYDLRRWAALDGNDYDDVFTDLVRRADGWSEAGIRFPNAGLELIVEASPEFREWVIYAPTSRPVVCLESYTGTSNAVNLQARGVDAGLVVLNPGGTWTATIRTQLRVSR